MSSANRKLAAFALSGLLPCNLGCASPGDPTAAASSGSTASTTSGGGGGAGGQTTCADCSAVMVAGNVASPLLIEASGLVASAVHPDVFYAHNDSGDTARFFALGSQGQDLGTFDVTGATAIDWEDISRGACAIPSESCLYLADTGDNALRRAEYVIYRVKEPAALAPGTSSVAAEALRFTYPDGPHNAEALLVHPTTGVVYIVTKSAAETRLYSLPLPLDPANTSVANLEGVVAVPDMLPLVTAGDFRPDGTAILLRSYASVWLYRVDGTVAAALAETPCLLPTPVETQGESIAYTRDGSGYRTLSEGSTPELHAVSCASPW